MKTNYYIALQPICDRKLIHVGDELLYRSATNDAAEFDDDMLATARSVHVAFHEFDIQDLVAHRKLFINVSREWLLNPHLLPPHPQQVVVEVLESVEADTEVLHALQQIRAQGYAIALDDFVLNEGTQALLDVATLVKIDRWQTMSAKEVDYYKQKGLKLLAEKVEEVEDFKRLSKLGFDYFQGYFYAKPELQLKTRRERSSNRKAQLKILSELQKEYPSFERLEELIVQDPQLTFVVLRQANSVYYARINKAHTVYEAINTIGLKQVKSIVLTIMLADNGPASRLLLPQLLTRAAMCEHLALEQNLDPDLAFTAGLLSLMNVFMGRPLDELLLETGLDELSMRVIIEHYGAIGQLLKTVEDFEAAQIHSLQDYEAEELNQAWLESRVWAEKILKETLLSPEELRCYGT